MSSPFQPLHPTLKACKCGFIGSRTKFYNHMTQAEETCKFWLRPATDYLTYHGEVPLKADDARVHHSTPILVTGDNLRMVFPTDAKPTL